MYLLFSLQCIFAFYGWTTLMLTYCQKSRRKQATRKSVLFKLFWTALLTYWAYLTVEIIKKDTDFDSEWDPYKVLKLEDNG